MRIITGRAKGLRLKTPKNFFTRPTADRVKESLFNILSGLINFSETKSVLDIFAGTGALGLEALSRGAATVHGFERNRANCAVIRQNIAAVERNLPDKGKYILHQDDAKNAPAALAAFAGRIDLVLADPPYDTAEGDYGWRELMLDNALADIMADDAILALEHGSEKELPFFPESKWKCIRSKCFGIRCVSYCVLVKEER